MPRQKRVSDPEAVANTAPEQQITTTEIFKDKPVKVSAPSHPKVTSESTTDYSEIECEGVRIRRFNPGGDAERMFKYLASCPKIPSFIPLGWGEKDGAEQWIQLNDLAFQIKKNQMVNLPKPVAEQLLESLKFTAEALNPMVQDGDGRWTRAQSGAKRIEVQK